MTIKLKQFLKKLIFQFGPHILFCKKSYAQEGEDLVVDRLLVSKKNGFYIEVGAHHPFRFSNTYLFYKRGWSGICIDPMPGTKETFRRSRPRDIVFELGVSEKPGKLQYFMFNEPALNTFDSKLADERHGSKGYKVINRICIDTLPLSEILSGQKIPSTGIDLMSVDVEGLDYQVLVSHDWHQYPPRIIIAEALNMKFQDIESDPIYTLLVEKGYCLYAKTGHSLIFQLRGQVA